MIFKDDITGRPLVVSNQSTQVVRRALVVAHRSGDITDTEYKMAYAEVCELGFLPQGFGGRPVPPAVMDKWVGLRSWANYTAEDFVWPLDSYR